MKQKIYEFLRPMASMLPTEFKKKVRGILNIRYREPKNVAIIGWLGAFNLGDDMMLDVTLSHLDACNHTPTLLVHDTNDEVKKKYDRYRLVQRRPLTDQAIEDVVSTNDALWVNGGALIDDKRYDSNESLARDIARVARAFIAQQKKVIVYGVSVSADIQDATLIQDYKFIIENATYFSTRDTLSKRELVRLTGSTSIRIVDDIEFADSILGNLTERVVHESDSIVFIPILLNDTLDAMVGLIRKINEATRKKITLALFYMEDGNDRKEVENIKKRLSDNSGVIETVVTPGNAAELREALDNSNIVVSMRYHGTLFAGAIGKKVVSIEYDTHPQYEYKNQYLRETYGFGTAVIHSSAIESSSVDEIAAIIKNAQRSDRNIQRVNRRAKRDIRKAMSLL